MTKCWQAVAAQPARGFLRVAASLLFALHLGSCSSPPSGGERELVDTSHSAVVYGKDDRVELLDAANGTLRDLAKEVVVAVMTRDTLRFDGDSVQVVGPTLGEIANLCPGERFADQPSVALCSGILLGSQTVLTAGHCMGRIACSDAAFVFGYYLQSSGTPALKAEDVYGCKEVVAQTLSVPMAAERTDFAWVKLDRPVPARARPVALRATSATLEVGESVTVVGFGGGTPMKVNDGGRVADPRPDTLDYFVTTSDTFHGDSGAPVFDAQRRLVGVHVRGNPDYVTTAAGCNTASQLPDEPQAAGEQSTYIAGALDGLCQASPESDLCYTEKQPRTHVPARPQTGCSACPRNDGASPLWVAICLLHGILSTRRLRAERRRRLRARRGKR